MRRIDVIIITLAILGAGGLVYGLFQVIGLDSINAGRWSQLILVGGVLAWVSTYLFRVGTQTMTYNQQRRDYEDALLQQRWESLTPEERAELEAKLEAEAAANSDSST
ncbi:DUF3007 family protein [Roseofilum casamattae]|uniref:DUF3007 family protein n=1 Tax=Roseofilum casamattae BLCC-M143 TaxID=3022442 RepID=A0ABT7BUR7_9CYAN|nr:DUF3007 family protein [Roseofilum casamattae]MDJ1182937.1 DUF3007 family protein [Roseofilum casamattae BLCC-M143]